MAVDSEVGERVVISDERRAAVAAWISDNVRPAAHVLAEAERGEPALEFEVREHQLEAWAALWDARQDGRERALLHLAPGLGKTTVAAIDAMRFREECARQRPPVVPRILYVSHKHEINQQAAKRFRFFMPDLEILFFNTRQAKSRRKAGATFATFQGLYSQLDTFDPEDFEYIVWDEGHHTEAATYKKVVDHFRPLFSYVATATPDRMDGKDIRDYFGEPVYSKGLAEAIAEGLLADVDYHIVFDSAIKAAIKAGFAPKTLSEIEGLFKYKPNARALTKSIRHEIAALGLDDPKIIVFCQSVAEAEEIAAHLGGVAYHSDSSDKHEVLESFRSGKLRIITTRDMFNEGVDVPDTGVIVFFRATGSPTIFEQQLGRGLRLVLGKERVYVFDYVANIERIAKIRVLSEAIRRRAEEIGDRTATEEDATDKTDRQSGLHIHTKHGDFDFDKIAVDILNAIGGIRVSEYHEGWLSSGTIAEMARVGKHTIDRLAKATGVAGTILVDERGIRVTHYSPEQQALIAIALAEKISGERPQDGWVTATEINKRYGIPMHAIKSTVASLGLEGRRRKNGRGREATYYTAYEVEQIIGSAPESHAGAVVAPDGYLDIQKLKRLTGLAPDTIRKRVAELGLVWRVYQGRRRQPCDHLSRDQVELLRASLGFNFAPEGFVAVSEAAKSLGVSQHVLEQLVAQEGLTFHSYDHPHAKVATRYLDAAQLSQIRPRAAELIAVPDRPDGYLTRTGIMEELGVSKERVQNIVRKLAVSPSKYRDPKKGRILDYYSPEQIQQIRDEILHR